MTGEVLTGDERLATGDAVMVAKRLEEAAAPGKVLIGEPTLTLVRSAVDAGRRALEMKGKPEPAAAHGVLHVRDEPMARPIRRLSDARPSFAFLLEALGPSGAYSALRARHNRRRGRRGVAGLRRVPRVDLDDVVGGRCPPSRKASPTYRLSSC